MKSGTFLGLGWQNLQVRLISLYEFLLIMGLSLTENLSYFFCKSFMLFRVEVGLKVYPRTRHQTSSQSIVHIRKFDQTSLVEECLRGPESLSETIRTQ